MTKPKAPQDRKRRGRPRKKLPPLSTRKYLAPVTRTALHPFRGPPVKWDSRRYWVLLVNFAALQVMQEMPRRDALEFLAEHYGIGFPRDKRETVSGRSTRQVEKRIREARADAEKYGWANTLPDWAKPALHPGF